MLELTPEQVIQVKEQLIKQIENLPEEQKKPLIEQINSMNKEQLEKFVEENKLISIENNQNKETKTTNNPFRLIIEDKLPNYKIAENQLAKAVLDINPLTKGHSLIIPKIPTEIKKLPEEIIRFSQLLAAHLKEKLSCKDIQISSMEAFNEGIINLLPIYDGEEIKNERQKISEEELENLQKELFLPPLENPNAKPEPPKKIIKQETEIKSEPMPEKPKKTIKKRKTPMKKLPKAPKRIP